MNKTKFGLALENFTVKCGVFIGCHKWLYYLLNFTWGILGTLIGALVWLILLPWKLPSKEKTFLGAVKTPLVMHSLTIKSKKEIKYNWGFSVGLFYFVSMGARDSIPLNSHEAGHSYQNALFGPFQLFILLASVIRFWVRHISEMRGKKPITSYDSIWFEKSASTIGNTLFITQHSSNKKK